MKIKTQILSMLTRQV